MQEAGSSLEAVRESRTPNPVMSMRVIHSHGLYSIKEEAWQCEGQSIKMFSLSVSPVGTLQRTRHCLTTEAEVIKAPMT